MDSPIIVYCNNLYYGRYTWNIPKDKFLTLIWMMTLETHCILASEKLCIWLFPCSCRRVDETDWTDEIHDSPPPKYYYQY